MNPYFVAWNVAFVACLAFGVLGRDRTQALIARSRPELTEMQVVRLHAAAVLLSAFGAATVTAWIVWLVAS